MGDISCMNPACCPVIPPPPPLPPAVLISDEYVGLTNLMEASLEWQCYRDVCNASLPPVVKPSVSSTADLESTPVYSTPANITTDPYTSLQPSIDQSILQESTPVYSTPANITTDPYTYPQPNIDQSVLQESTPVYWTPANITTDPYTNPQPNIDQSVLQAASASAALPVGISLAVIFIVMCVAALLWYRHKKRSGRTFALDFKEYRDKNFLHNKTVKNQCWKRDSIPTTDDQQKTAAMFQTQNDYVELGTEKRDPQYLLKGDNIQEIDVESPRHFENLNAEGDITGDYTSYDNASFTKENGDTLGHSPGANSHTPLFDEPDSAKPASLPPLAHGMGPTLEAETFPPLAHGMGPKLEAATFVNSGTYNSSDKLPPVEFIENSEKVSKPKIRSSKKKHGHRKSKRISDPGAGATTQHETAVRLKSV